MDDMRNESEPSLSLVTLEQRKELVRAVAKEARGTGATVG